MQITEKKLQMIHALVMGDGRKKLKPSPYRDGQNVIRDMRTKQIIYRPSEAKDVSGLMGELIAWVNAKPDLPIPLIAALLHYQFATIHPY